MSKPTLYLALALLAWLMDLAALVAAPAPNEHFVGVAAVDITPKYPVRLNGFGFRRIESEGVTQRLWAKALAFGQDEPAVVLTVDNLGVPDAIVAELAHRLATKGITRDRLAVTSTHTHTAPMLQGACPTIFGVPIPKEHQQRIDQYTRELTDHLEKVTLAALADRKPARLSWGIGQVSFAVNRRTTGGPVDHDLPLLVVRDLKGKIRALWVNYACHAVTLSHNKIGGDWPGYAQEAIQDEQEGAIALVSIGCGADSNPSSGVTGDKVEIASRQGREIAHEVKRLLSGYLAPVTGSLTVASRTIELPLVDLPSKEQWQRRANRKDAVGYHAGVQLERLARGEKLRTKIDYRITTWTFGDSLALVFLPGEVVVDYALKLKRDLDGRRLWINAYSNDAPCYIPSERILKEGGYEGGGAMVYYDVPAPFRPGLEKKILDTVHAQLGKRFAAPFDPARTSTLPLSPQQSLACLVTKKGLTVDLVAAEPLLASPVAIDFGPDGRLWVAEMFDYPSGTGPNFRPGGRVSVLEDVDGDGNYDKATIFLNNIPFPTGITVWRNGVLICAAPDILYAEDTDGDGKADKVVKLFTGFGTENYQARVNSLCYGLDGWVYGSCGMFGGTIINRSGVAEKLGHRDFRLRPDEGRIEAASGRTQQGRARNDWEDWFGCDSVTLARHYVLPDHYLRRNPHLTYPNPAVYVPDYPDSNRLYPLRPLQLFELSGPAGQATGACGLGVYRDDLLGKGFTGNLFTCEPVNLAVHRLTLSPRGSTFSGRRPSDEKDREFLASTDGWFRPVQARTGPDGALWVVDMYRFVIEHPTWVPPGELAKVDVRAGATMGRIYRIRPSDAPLRKPVRLDKATPNELVAALDSPNGVQRDLAGQMLLWRGEESVTPALIKLTMSKRAEARLHALCVLDGLGKLATASIRKALSDEHPGVRRHAVRLAEKHLEEIGPELLKLTTDKDAQVRLQLAFTLGAWRDPRAARALADLVGKHAKDRFLVAAVLSSVSKDNVSEVLTAVLEQKPPPLTVVQHLLTVTAAVGDREALATALARVTTADGGRLATWQFAALGGILDALERRKQAVPDPKGVSRVIAQARQVAADTAVQEAERLAAIGLLGREDAERAADITRLGELLVPQSSPAIQSASLAALGRLRDDAVATTLLTGWKSHTPAIRSQVLELLMGRPAWLDRLLTALEKNEILPNQVDATRRQRLLTHRDEKIRQRTAKLFAGSSSDRQKVVNDYASALSLTADAGRGKAVFVKHCSACHLLEGVGHVVGPDLTAVAHKAPDYLLGEILDPNRNLGSGYVQYQVTTKRGLTYVGLLAAETATSLTLRLQEGKTHVLLRSEVEEMSSSGQSLMPEGLEKDLTRQDLADLLVYITRQKRPKSFPGNQPVTVRASQGSYVLPASACEIYGGDICFEPLFTNVGCWHGVDDRVVWAVEVMQDTTFDVWLDWSCADDVAGNPFVLEGGKVPLRGTVKGTGGWNRYQQEKIGQLTLAAGTQRLTFRPDAKLRGALLDLRGVHLVPPGTKPVFTRLDKPAKPSPAELAKQILDEKLPPARRQALIEANPEISTELLAALVADLKPGTKEEYRRIPWIWRVTIAAGKRNEAAELKKVLDVSLPKADGPLHDWQAVVLGGGVINGISLIGKWPGERMKELLDSRDRQARWERALQEAVKMADDGRVPTGTRYDALRMIALEGWDKRGAQLKKYLAKGTHDELTMGAISGLSDIDSAQVAPALLAGLGSFSAGNRKLAIEALLRTEERALALLGALEGGKLRKDSLSMEQQKALKEHRSEKVRSQAAKVLGK